MKPRSTIPFRIAMGVGVMIASALPSASAATFTWGGPKISGTTTFQGGVQNWNDPANWLSDTSGTFPNGIDAVAQTRVNWGASPTLMLNETITLGRLSLGDTAITYYQIFIQGNGGSFVFDSVSGTTTVTKQSQVNSGATTSARMDVVSAAMAIMTPVFENNILNTTGIGRLTFSGDVTAGSAGLKMISHVSTATGTGSSFLNYSGNITDGIGQIGILVNPTSAGGIPFKLTGTGNAFTGPVTILRQTLEALPISGTNGALGTGTLQLGESDPGATNSATLNLGGSPETLTEHNPIVVPNGSSGARRIALIGDRSDVLGSFYSGNRIMAGELDVQNSGGVTLACGGTGSLTFSNAIRGTGPITINSTGSGKVIFAGAGSTHSGTVTIQSRELQLAGASALGASTIVPVAGGTMALAPSLQATVGGLAPTAGGLVDVGTGFVTVTSGLSPVDLVTAIVAGRGDGSWNGSAGITSSAAALDPNRAVGWLENGDGSVSFAYAAAGDTNLDWSIDLLDIGTYLAAGKYDTGEPSGWSEGDYTYDGLVDITDVALYLGTGLFDTGPYNPPAGNSVGVAAVPEPLGLGSVALAVIVCAMVGRKAPRSEHAVPADHWRRAGLPPSVTQTGDAQGPYFG